MWLWPEGRDGEPIGATLTAAQAATRWQGQGRFCLLGSGDLRMSDAPTPADRSVEQLVESARAGDDAIWRELLPRLTLQAFQTGGDSSPATQSLRDHLALPELGAPDANLHLLHRLAPIVDTLPVLTRLWAAPLLTHLAEQHHHERLDCCRRRLEDLAKAHPESVNLYADWAKAEYRRGHYARAVAATMEGLRCAAKADETVIRLLGSLVNLLIDFNLPRPAQDLFDLRNLQLDQLDGNCVAKDGGNFVAKECFKGLDFKGRLALREGDYPAALVLFRSKRIQAPEHDKDEKGWRELAWLLYASALAGPIKDDICAAGYAQECRAILANRPEPGTGNDDVLYLLRALAAWAWRQRDGAAWQALAPWLPELGNRLERRQDTGPVGFTLCYLHLYQREFGGTLALPDWGTICVALERDRYFFELAVFNRLLERPQKKIEGWLNRYHQQRRAVMDKLALKNRPDWLQSAIPGTGLEDLSNQESREHELLLGTGKSAWNVLVDAHLLPW